MKLQAKIIMTYYKYALLLCAVTVLTSCEKIDGIDNSNLSSEQFVPIWSNILSPDNEQLNFGVIRQDIWYNENVLLPKQLASHVSLAMLNSLTGEELWQWDDFYPIDRGSIIISTSHQCKNLLYFGVNNRLYGIDLTNGQTILKQKIPGFSIRRLSGFGEVLLLSGYEMNVEHGYEVPVVYTLKSQLNAPEKLFEAPQTYEFVNRLNFTGFIGSPKRISHAGDDILCYAYSINKDSEATGDIFFGAFNYTADTMLYVGKSILEDARFYANGPDLVYGTKIFFSPTTSILCYEGQTGEKLWATEFPSGFTFSGYIAADGKILANCEDTYLYALDPETGNILWTEKSSGTSSKMIAHNGVVYFVGGGDGLLHAVDIETGRHLWKIRSPHLELNNGAWFMPKVNVVPSLTGGKATVVVSSYIGAFGYEAIR